MALVLLFGAGLHPIQRFLFGQERGGNETNNFVRPVDQSSRRNLPVLRNQEAESFGGGFVRREDSSDLVWHSPLRDDARHTATAANLETPITISAPDAAKWREGQTDVWHLIGPVKIRQGDTTAQANEALIWIDLGDPYIGEPDRLVAYLEGNVEVSFGRSGDPRAETGLSAQSIHDQRWLGRFTTTVGLQLDVLPSSGRPDEMPLIYQRANDYHRSGIDPAIQPSQFTVPVQDPISNPNQPIVGAMGANGMLPVQEGFPVQVQPRTDVEIVPRSSGVDFTFNAFDDPVRNERVIVYDRGVKITIRSNELPGIVGGIDPATGQPTQIATTGLDTIVILADRVVAWTNQLDILAANETPADVDERWELYLEGHIVFAFAERVIYADRMYYDVNNRRGTILNAEMLTPVPNYEGLVRLKAKILQQIDQDNFRAYQAAFTSSRLGFPRYWLQAGDVSIQHEQRLTIDPFTGQPAVNQFTGELIYDHEYQTRASNNFVFIDGTPVFYWPTLATDLADPTFYLNGLSVKNDGVYGTQILTSWNLYQVLGIDDPPENTDWSLLFDYMSERGFGLGTEFEYQGVDLFGTTGPYRGRFEAWGINEQGLDNLGADRRALVPEKDFRGRVQYQHRQRFDVGWQLTGEFGLVSDRNFLEQYYEHEWDQQKDPTTGLELKRVFRNQSFNVSANVRLNDFFAETQWLPRLDHFIVGQPLLLDRLQWTGHSHVGYGRLNTADAPLDPNDSNFRILPWERDVDGVRAGTRHEVSSPFSAGPVRVAPYLLGDLTYWEQDLNFNSVTRLYGQAGVRANLPIWKANPSVNSELLNLNGLAHKVDFNLDAFWSDASEDLGTLPLYDALDDNPQEQFRRRFAFDNFGGPVIPNMFDERNFAFRRGLQNYVTSPSAEVADDLFLTRIGVSQRWQTKRGWPGQRRVVDWISLDVNGTFFPEKARDNFGTNFGMIDYDLKWNIGDRVAILSDGFFDLFGDGLRTASIGATTNRPESGSVYVGYRSIEGPITSNIVSASLSYRMSEKWIATAGTSVDFGPTGNIGQTLSFTRIGESFLVRVGIRADASRGNVGAVLGIEPRFLPRERMNQIGGVYVPPPGVRGPE